MGKNNNLYDEDLDDDLDTDEDLDLGDDFEGEEGDDDSQNTSDKSSKPASDSGKKEEPQVDERDEELASLRAKIQELEKSSKKESQADTQSSPEDEYNRVVSAAKQRLAKLSDDYEEALLEGERDKAKKIRAEREKLQDDFSEYRLNYANQATRNSVSKEVYYTRELETQLERHPQLDSESDIFDSELADDVNALRLTYMNKGEEPHIALRKAVKRLIPDKPTKSSEDVSSQRNKDARKRNADANRRQPPNLSDVGSDYSKDDISQPKTLLELSEAEFDKLSDEELAKARGDFL